MPGMKKGLNAYGFTAQDHAAEWVEAIGMMRGCENIEDHMNDLKLSVRHPYWQPRIDDRVLRIIEGQLELLREIIGRKE